MPYYIIPLKSINMPIYMKKFSTVYKVIKQIFIFNKFDISIQIGIASYLAFLNQHFYTYTSI